MQHGSVAFVVSERVPLNSIPTLVFFIRIVHLYCIYQPACKGVGGFTWRASFACVLP